MRLFSLNFLHHYFGPSLAQRPDGTIRDIKHMPRQASSIAYQTIISSYLKREMVPYNNHFSYINFYKHNATISYFGLLCRLLYHSRRKCDYSLHSPCSTAPTVQYYHRPFVFCRQLLPSLSSPFIYLDQLYSSSFVIEVFKLDLFWSAGLESNRMFFSDWFSCRLTAHFHSALKPCFQRTIQYAVAPRLKTSFHAVKAHAPKATSKM